MKLRKCLLLLVAFCFTVPITIYAQDREKLIETLPLYPYVYYDKDKNLLKVYEDVENYNSKPSERNIFRLCNDFVNGWRQRD